jgi:hypothetical protein
MRGGAAGRLKRVVRLLCIIFLAPARIYKKEPLRFLCPKSQVGYEFPKLQKEAACLQGLDRILADHSRARRAFAKPELGLARRGERARMFFFLSLTHTCKSIESIQLFKLDCLHLH